MNSDIYKKILANNGKKIGFSPSLLGISNISLCLKNAFTNSVKTKKNNQNVYASRKYRSGDRIEQRIINNGVVVDFGEIYCSKGCFQMGVSKSYTYLSSVFDNKVCLTRDFWISETKVTIGLWESIVGSLPFYYEIDPDKKNQKDTRPITNISWYDALLFCNKLSDFLGLDCYYSIEDYDFFDIYKSTLGGNKKYKVPNVSFNINANGYRLPTDAEWEYAAKAGHKFRVSCNFSGSDKYDAVGSPNKYGANLKSFLPNNWGIYDMSNYYFEYCQDAFVKDLYKERAFNGEMYQAKYAKINGLENKKDQENDVFFDPIEIEEKPNTFWNGVIRNFERNPKIVNKNIYSDSDTNSIFTPSENSSIRLVRNA